MAQALESVDPSTNEPLNSYPVVNQESPEQLDCIVASVHDAFTAWKTLSVAQRVKYLASVAQQLEEEKHGLALLATQEMGKPINEALAEVEKCAWVCRYYTDNAERFLADQQLSSDASNSVVAFEPLGAVLAVMPWNFPYWQVFRFAAPALAAGNTCLLKHASNVSGCALAIERVFHRAGLPENVFRTLLIFSEQVPQVIAHQGVRAVTLTGSVNAGRKVAEAAGKAIKKTVLELGGSDPYLILEDADIELAVEKCVVSRLINSGQSCIGAKRFIVVESQRQAFEQSFVEKMKAITYGDPRDEENDIGPLAKQKLRDDLHQQVEKSIAAGATLLLGGDVPEGPGYYYPPSVLTDVNATCPAYSEELFGPVAAIIPARNEAEAIRIANDSCFGLGAAVFSTDTTRAERVARKLEAGCCFINDFVKSDPRLPFGGIKKSGYGRELSEFGIREFVNVKTIVTA